MVASSRQATTPGLVLPPAYRLVALREWGDAHAHACRIAAAEGAGAFVWVRRFDVLEFAVVLEPDEPLVSARRATFAGMAALADALASFAPPEKPVAFAWPTTILLDGGRLGGGRLAWPQACGEDDVPAWLVFSGMLLASPTVADPGAHADATWLEEEGVDPSEMQEVVASFARHLMVAFDAWSERGFDTVADAYLARLARDDRAGRRGIDGNGDLLVHRGDGLERMPLLPGLVAADWFDPATGLPRL